MPPPPDLSLLKQFSSESLSSLLRQLAGEKDIILDPQIMKCLDKISRMETLKSSGVKRVYKMQTYTELDSSSLCKVFFLQASMEQTRAVIELMRSAPSASSASNVVLVYFPKVLQGVLSLLEEEGLADRVLVREFCWRGVPLDAETFSLEMPLFFPRCIVDGDLAQLGVVAKTLLDVEGLYGLIPSRAALGKKSSAVLSQLALLESQCGPPTSGGGLSSSDPEFGHLLVVDRDSDFTSCLLSPITYESLLDEVFDIALSQIDFSQTRASVEDELRKEKLDLVSRDRVFEQVRHKHISSIFALLGAQARQCKQEQTKAASMNVTEMKDFVQNKLKVLHAQSRSISVHLDASDVIQREMGYVYEDVLPLQQELIRGAGHRAAVSFLERAISQMFPAHIVFRSLCLISRNTHLSTAEYTKFKKLICDAYGHRHVSTFLKLEQMGLLHPNGAQSRFPVSAVDHAAVKAKLGLTPPKSESDGQQDLVMDRDPSYVFARCHTPAACRLAKLMAESPDALQELARTAPSLNLTVQQTARALQASMSNFTFVVAGTSKESGRSVMEHVMGTMED